MSQIFKILLVGDVSTGKTSFLTQLIYQDAEKMPKPTKQLAFFTLRISNPQTIIQVWDSPGDQKYYYKILSILQGFDAVILFVDVTNEHTLLKAKIIIDQLKVYPYLSIHLIESKVQMVIKAPYKRKVFTEQLKKIAQSVGGCVFSYLQSESVQDILRQVATWKKKKPANKIFDKNNPKITNDQRKYSQNQKSYKQEKNSASNFKSDSQFCDCMIY